MAHPPGHIISAHDCASYNNWEVTTVASNLLFMDFETPRFGIILAMFCVILFAFIVTTVTCSLNRNFKSNCSPRYLILMLDAISIILIFTLIGFCFLLLVMAIASDFSIATSIPALSNDFSAVSAASSSSSLNL